MLEGIAPSSGLLFAKLRQIVAIGDGRTVAAVIAVLAAVAGADVAGAAGTGAV